MITGNNKLRQIVARIEEDILMNIRSYIQGAVYCWCKNVKDNDGNNKWFVARDLFGGDNKTWEGTPLIIIYQWHLENGTNDPVDMAGKDVGKHLKQVVEEDRRIFDTREGYTREYVWTGRES